MSVRRSRSCWLWAFALSLASGSAHAAPSARLVYVREPGAESCPDEASLRRAVAARLGYDPFFPWATVTLVAHVRKDTGAFRAEVTLVDDAGVARGKRAVEAPGDACAPLVGALALTISLALDPLSLGPKPAGEPAPPSPPPDPPAPPVPPSPPVPEEPKTSPVPPRAIVPEEPAWRGFIGLAALGSYGATPGIAFGGALRGGIERGAFSLGLEARADAPSSTTVPPAGSVSAWIAQGTLLGCGRVAIVVGCALVSAGPLVAKGVGLSVPRTAIVPYGAAGLRLSVAWPLGARFRLDGFAQVAFALARRALQVDGEDAFRQPAAAFTLGVGGAARIF